MEAEQIQGYVWSHLGFFSFYNLARSFQCIFAVFTEWFQVKAQLLKEPNYSEMMPRKCILSLQRKAKFFHSFDKIFKMFYEYWFWHCMSMFFQPHDLVLLFKNPMGLFLSYWWTCCRTAFLWHFLVSWKIFFF